MTTNSPFLIVAPEGYTPHIGRLVAMMTYARRTTLRAVERLTLDQLDYVQDGSANSIGALLAHIAAVEQAYQQMTFQLSDIPMTPEYQAALDLGDEARTLLRGRPLEHYVDTLNAVRERTLAEMRSRDDAWLDETTPFANQQPANNHWKWFHVFEDELSHRGQIRWLRKRLPSFDDPAARTTGAR